MVKRVGRDTAVRIDKRTATGIGCLVTIGIVLALMIVTFHAIARGDVPENPLTPVGVAQQPGDHGHDFQVLLRLRLGHQTTDRQA